MALANFTDPDRIEDIFDTEYYWMQCEFRSLAVLKFGDRINVLSRYLDRTLEVNKSYINSLRSRTPESHEKQFLQDVENSIEAKRLGVQYCPSNWEDFYERRESELAELPIYITGSTLSLGMSIFENFLRELCLENRVEELKDKPMPYWRRYLRSLNRGLGFKPAVKLSKEENLMFDEVCSIRNDFVHRLGAIGEDAIKTLQDAENVDLYSEKAANSYLVQICKVATKIIDQLCEQEAWNNDIRE
jgi:hypothetical protein